MCALASDDPAVVSAGMRRLAELSFANLAMATHDPQDPGSASVSLAELQVVAVELRRLIHESTPADRRAVVAADDSFVAESDDAISGALEAADAGLGALLGAFDVTTAATSWSELPADVASTLARIGLVPSPTGDPAHDFAAVQARVERRRRAAGYGDEEGPPTGLPGDAVDAPPTWEDMRARLAALAGTAVPLLASFEMATGDVGVVLDGDLATVDEIDDWLDVASSVHANLGRLGRVVEMTGLFGLAPPPLVAGQVPRLPGDAWAAIARPAPGTGGRVAVAAMTHGAVRPGQPVVGLVVDRWSERIPNTDQLTGLAFHFDAPSAESPQTMLLAVPPVNRPWTSDLVVDAVLETVEWMQLRAVAIDDLGDDGHALPTSFVPGRLAAEAIVRVAS